MLAITHTTIMTPAKTISDGTVMVRDGLIESISKAADIELHAGMTEINGRDLILTPGFIDLQLNGGFGIDFTENPAGIWGAAQKMPRYGLTSFLPTIVTAPRGTVELAQEVLAEGPPLDFRGSIPLGLHAEGPFLNPLKKGAHNPKFLRPPDMAEVIDWSREKGVWLVTLAPELEGALALTTTLADRGILVSAGHSMATYDQGKTGINAGIRYATHLFNAMPAIHQREPGLIGAVMADERVTLGLIADLLHVHPSLLKVIWQVAEDGRLNLVTDAVAALGMLPGSYRVGDLGVMVDETGCRLPDGTLAGSVLSIDKAFKNLVTTTGCHPGEALRSVTATPASLLGLGDRKGQIAPGFDADLVLLTPEFDVVATIIAGELVYRR